MMSDPQNKPLIPPHLEEADTLTEGYLRYSGRKTLILVVISIAIVVMATYSMGLGSTDLTYGEIINYILHPDESWNSSVIWDSRLPKTVAAIVIGTALGISGAVMQAVLRNPMASPFTLGVSNASAFGAAIGIVLGGGVVVTNVESSYPLVQNEMFVTICAFLAALLSICIILGLIKAINATPETIVLSGMAITSIFGAGLSFLQYMADEQSMAMIVFWQFGSIDKVSWDHIAIIAVVTTVALAYFAFKAWDYNSMETGDETARGLGINLERTRIVALVVSALVTSLAVSFTGIIGFIGLIAPHIVKKLVGNDFRFVLAGSALVGAAVLLVSSMVASYAFSDILYTSLPVGILTSALGGPLFLFILYTSSKRRIRRC